MIRINRPALWIACASIVVAGCNGGDPQPRAVRAPQQTIVAVDLSGSQTPATLRDSRAFVEKTIDDLSHGDRFVLMEMGRTGVRGDLKRFVDTVADLSDSTFVSTADKNALQGKKTGFRSLVPMVFDTSLVGKIPHTDILATLFTAGQYVRESEGRPTTIILLSDMLQSANGVEMEGLRRMPSGDWIQRQKRMGTIPNLSGACIVVVGADASTSEGVAVRRFWQEYFQAAGAKFDEQNYALLSNATNSLGCKD